MNEVERTYIDGIEPAMALLPERMNSKQAIVMMLAIGLQESRLIHRKQIGGPAKGLYQFERGGGVRGVLNHANSKAHAKAVCDRLIGTTDISKAYDALEYNDILASAFCRLLLWTDPRALPPIGDSEAAWNLYMRTWRPGKPHRATWDGFYAQAVAYVDKL